MDEQKDICEQEGVEAFMCAVDWKYEAGECFSGNSIFYSLDSLKTFCPCYEECGIVKVKVSFVEVVQKGTDD